MTERVSMGDDFKVTEEWAALEVFAWPLMDPVTVVLGPSGVGIRRAGLAARLRGVPRWIECGWRDLQLTLSPKNTDRARITIGGEILVLHGEGARRLAAALMAGAAGLPHAGLPRCWDAGRRSAFLPSSGWLYVGSGGLAWASASNLPGQPAPVHVRSPEIRDAVLLEDDVLMLNGDQTLRWWVRAPKGLMFSVGEACVFGLSEARWVRDVPTDEEAVLVTPVAWSAGQDRVCRAMVFLYETYFCLWVDDDSDPVRVSFTGIRKLEPLDSGEDERVVAYSLDGHPHVLRALGLAPEFWPLAEARMFHQPTGEELLPAWKRAAGEAKELRIQDESGKTSSWRPVWVGVSGAGIAFVAAGGAPFPEAGSSVRAWVLKDSGEAAFLCQVAEPMKMGDIPAMALRAVGGDESAAIGVLVRSLQTEPDIKRYDRKHFRLDVDDRALPVKFGELSARSSAISGVIRNISARGIGIEAAAPVPPIGAQVSVWGLGESLGPRVERLEPFRATVVWIGKAGEDRCEVGLRFEDLPPHVEDQMHAAVISVQRHRVG